MELHTNEDTVCGKPTVEDVGQNGSIRKPYEQSLYERTFLSELIENHVIPSEPSYHNQLIKSFFRSVIVLLDVIVNQVESQYELYNV